MFLEQGNKEKMLKTTSNENWDGMTDGIKTQRKNFKFHLSKMRETMTHVMRSERFKSN